MILSGREIQRCLGKEIIIEPYDPACLNPNSYNLKLHNQLLVYENPVLDMKTPLTTRVIDIPEDGLVLEPNRLYLGRTSERLHNHEHVRHQSQRKTWRCPSI